MLSTTDEFDKSTDDDIRSNMPSTGWMEELKD
jgi:hypothetical protein